MTVIATLDVAAADFTFGGALAANPGIEVRLERVIPLGSTFIPYFWATDDTVEDIERALRAEADIESFSVVDSVNGEALVRVEWEEDLDGLLDAMAATDATILEATGSDDTWTFQLRFPDHDSLTAFYRECAEHGISLDLQSVHNPGIPEEIGLGHGITETQHATLQAALEKGYFDVPRRINLTDLAVELGVSDTAASQRIRRGISTLLMRTLSESDDESEDD
jgi:hypothetical protein